MSQRLDEDALRRAKRTLARKDPELGRWMKRIGQVDLPKRRTHFGYLIRAIVSQQVSNKAAATMCRRTQALFPRPHAPRPEQLLALDDEELRGAGVSRPKLKALRSLAEAFHEGPLAGFAFHRASDDEVIDKLLPIHGIGRWTAEMFLLFALRRPDVWSAGDLALLVGARRVSGAEELTPRAGAIHAERWAPWRSVAALYAWRISHWKDPEGNPRS